MAGGIIGVIWEELGSEFTHLQSLPKGFQVQPGLQKMADPIYAR